MHYIDAFYHMRFTKVYMKGIRLLSPGDDMMDDLSFSSGTSRATWRQGRGWGSGREGTEGPPRIYRPAGSAWTPRKQPRHFFPSSTDRTMKPERIPYS